MDQEIVDFVMSELSYGDCARNSLAVTNFHSQVVAGLRYKFDLEAVASAQCGDGAAESCHVEVNIDCKRILHDTNIVNVAGLLRAVERNQGDHLGCHHLHQAGVRIWMRDGHPPNYLSAHTKLELIPTYDML